MTGGESRGSNRLGSSARASSIDAVAGTVSRWALAVALASVASGARAASAQEATPIAPSPPAETTGPAERGISSPGLVAGGSALAAVGLGSTGLGVFLTLQGSTLDCIDCVGSSDDAPLVAGGLSAIVLGLGMAATGGTMIVLGLRDEPAGLKVRTEVRAGLDGITLRGTF